MPKQSVQFSAIVKLDVGLPGQGGKLHPSVAFPTGTQNPSELAAVVSFRDDYTKWRRIEVSWWVSAFTAPQAEFLMWVQMWVGKPTFL